MNLSHPAPTSRPAEAERVSWLQFEVAVPLALISCIWWPILWPTATSHLFLRVFAPGDALAIAFTLGVPVWVRLWSLRAKSVAHTRHCYICFGLVLSIGAFYIAVKQKLTPYDFPAQNTEVDFWVYICAFLSLAGSLSMVLYLFNIFILTRGEDTHDVVPR